MSWKRWLSGLLAAMIGSLGAVSGSAAGAYSLGYDIGDASFWHIIGGGIVGGGLAALATHVKDFPPPGTLKPQDPPAAPR